MSDPILSSSESDIPEEWRERFLLKRIDEEAIVISLAERDAILESLNAGARFIQVGKYILMLNSIKSIDPYYEPDNIPPRPKEVCSIEIVNGVAVQRVENKELLELWDKFFRDKLVVTNG